MQTSIKGASSPIVIFVVGSILKICCDQGHFVLSAMDANGEAFIEVRQGFDADAPSFVLKEKNDEQFSVYHCAIKLKIIGNKLISIDHNQNAMKIWDMNARSCLHTQMNMPWIRNIFDMDGMVILEGTLGATIIGDLETGKLLNVINSETEFNARFNRVAATDPILLDGMILKGVFPHGIHVLDLNPQPNQILEEMVLTLDYLHKSWVTGSDMANEELKRLIQRFSYLPEDIKNAIYGELFNIVQPANHYWGIGEHLFHEQSPDY